MHDLFYPELILHWLILLKAFMEKIVKISPTNKFIYENNFLIAT